MKHLKVYEDQKLDGIMQRLSDISVIDKMTGWWITADIPGGYQYFALAQKDEAQAAKQISLWLLSGSGYSEREIFEKINSFKDVIKEFKDHALGRLVLIVWEMTPRNKYKSYSMSYTIDNIPLLHDTGKNEFIDFDRVMNQTTPKYYNTH